MFDEMSTAGWFEVVDNDFDDSRQNVQRFDPSSSPMHQRISHDQLIEYNNDREMSQLRYRLRGSGNIVTDHSSVVISIDGACRGNGTPHAQASFGVCLGPNFGSGPDPLRCPMNWSGLLPEEDPQTSSFAEIYALQEALQVISNVILPDTSLSHVYIVSDSSYLVTAFTEYMGRWLENGGYTSRGEQVAHWEILQDIQETIDEMRYGDDGGMDIKFWLVPRQMNRAADALANRAFNRR